MTKRLTFSTFIGSLFGIGFIPFAPGTFGTLFAVIIYWFIPESVFTIPNAAYYFGGLAILSVISALISTSAEKILGKDAGTIVIDELCGYFVTVALLPKTIPVLIYSFILFRVFDIAKPFPIKQSQNIKAGWGVTVDDLLAGIYANVLIQILIKLYPKFFGTI
ncbi:MAG: phosphatidylglycerophosphatase A [Candidatus Cloacimonetes bacterium HGW-Cloacimonetes-1]|jgi:phosphatidylglycerophosphatase A|nr:MAG: phosphatidylglycerophosphatase A [Candidatus Cloacimonetes bacterium HGW-Cloacimonetes-1]